MNAGASAARASSLMPGRASGLGFALALGALLAACSSYHLGPTAALPFHSLYVSPVTSKAYVPQAQAPLTEGIRQALLEEGNLQLTNQDQADATLDVTITDYQRVVAATTQSNTLNAQAFTLMLTANCTLVDNHNGKVYFKNRTITASAEAVIGSNNDFNEVEYETIPILARDLGSKIRDTIVTTW
jgi:outer membrane lipopolysaccharide assembly protein LptE/RlpB